MGSGVPTGAEMVFQVWLTNPSIPASATVGISLNAGNLVVADTANAFTAFPRTCPTAVNAGSNTKVSLSAIKSTMASGLFG